MDLVHGFLKTVSFIYVIQEDFVIYYLLKWDYFTLNQYVGYFGCHHFDQIARSSSFPVFKWEMLGTHCHPIDIPLLLTWIKNNA